MATRTTDWIDFPKGAFADVSRATDRLGLDLGDVLAIAATVIVSTLAGSERVKREPLRDRQAAADP